MEFHIDVSGEDLLSKDYTICVANKDGIIKGFKFNEKLIKILRAKHGQGLYRYKNSKQQKSLFKLRLYCITIHYLFKSIKNIDKISLIICRDFDGKANDINFNLKHFLENKLKLSIETSRHERLPKDSNAHKYAYLMRKDNKNKMKTYVKISLQEFEEFLKK